MPYWTANILLLSELLMRKWMEGAARSTRLSTRASVNAAAAAEIGFFAEKGPTDRKTDAIAFAEQQDRERKAKSSLWRIKVSAEANSDEN